ncbi:hypothetical protein BH11BAC4_BH11BAC4_06680 [soil metagenome]
MDYTVSLLKTRPDCEALINIATNDKESFLYRKTGLKRQRDSASSTSVEIEADLASVNAELAAYQTILASLPDGPARDNTLVLQTKAQYKKFLLEERKGSYGVLAILEKEFNFACIDQSIAETDAFLAAVTARMSEMEP